MKIKLAPILVLAYFLLTLVISQFKIYPLIFFAFVVVLGYFTNIKNGIKNLLYLLSALSAFLPLFAIFLIYLPFTVFGMLLKERNFIRDYILGFAISFIPTTIIYLISTYLSIPLNIAIIAVLVYLLPVMVFAILREKSIKAFELSNRELIFFLTFLFFATVVAINIVDDNNLFMANAAREFYRIQLAVEGIGENGLIPIYNPGIGHGEDTYLWIPPANIIHFATSNLLLKFIDPLLFYNAHSFFLLFIFILSLSFLFSKLTNDKSNIGILAVIAVSLVTGLNFFILQSIEGLKAFTGYPIATLLAGIIIGNPKKFSEFVVIMYLSALMLLVHPSLGFGTTIFAISLFFFTKLYYFKDRSELKYFFKWIMDNKLKVIIILALIGSLPLFYVSTPSIFKDFLSQTARFNFTLELFKNTFTSFYAEYRTNEFSFLSFSFPGYPDVNRIDDHKFGFFISVIGLISFFLLMFLYRSKSLKNYRVFAFGYLFHLFLLSLLTVFGERVGGFFKTPGLYLLVLLGASILALIYVISNKNAKLAMIAIIVVFAAFLHMMPYAKQNISNIHREGFMSGDIYKNELDFISQLPVDGRILTYGLFDNVVDYGINYITGRYGSRNEKTSLQSARTPHEKIHDQNSFGDPGVIIGKFGAELSNYLKAGGYKYVFMNIAHPVANYVLAQIYPNFSYPIYQNGPLVILVVNDTYYAEKVNLVEQVDDRIYKQTGGYKYTTIGRHYDYDYSGAQFETEPKEPEPLRFERLSPEKVGIYGNFSDGGWVVFKEQYFARWKAYMGGKEIPVFTNNHEMILLRTISGDTILLEYSLLPIEKFIGIVSLAGFLFFSLFVLFLVRQGSLNAYSPE